MGKTKGTRKDFMIFCPRQPIHPQVRKLCRLLTFIYISFIFPATVRDQNNIVIKLMSDHNMDDHEYHCLTQADFGSISLGTSSFICSTYIFSISIS